MKIFKHRRFNQWAKSAAITDEHLANIIHEIEQGIFEANLGSGLYKKRIAKKGHGKRGGYRTLLAFRHHNKAFFMYGFAKNERENITEKEKDIYKLTARYYLNTTESQLDALINNGVLIEVKK